MKKIYEWELKEAHHKVTQDCLKKMGEITGKDPKSYFSGPVFFELFNSKGHSKIEFEMCTCYLPFVENFIKEEYKYGIRYSFIEVE